MVYLFVPRSLAEGCFASIELDMCDMSSHFVLDTYQVGEVIFEVSGESFVEPDDVPPGNSDEVSEPLMGIFVGDDGANELLVVARRLLLIVQDVRLPAK